VRTVGRRSSREEYCCLPRYSLVVCATLVQNPINLGGLCRTCEALVVANLAVLQTSDFRKVAASSHHWQPIVGCSVEQLPEWLLTQQQQGYSLVALHPAATSRLDQLTFPLRSVLILGQELTGIPAEIASLCQHSVSIAQFGMVESLNVQTAGAIAIYEYIRQQLPTGT
jgi:tRNA G18 (ribose-2'-O)-methylase SpoU